MRDERSRLGASPVASRPHQGLPSGQRPISPRRVAAGWAAQPPRWFRASRVGVRGCPSLRAWVTSDYRAVLLRGGRGGQQPPGVSVRYQDALWSLKLALGDADLILSKESKYPGPGLALPLISGDCLSPHPPLPCRAGSETEP